MAFLSQATSSWRLASSSRLPFRSMLLTPRGGPWCLAPRAHQIPVYLMVFSTFLCRAFTAHGKEGVGFSASPSHALASLHPREAKGFPQGFTVQQARIRAPAKDRGVPQTAAM